MRKIIHKIKNWHMPSYLFLTGFIVLSLFPIYWMVLSSFKKASQVTKMPPVWLPEITFESYVAIFETAPFLHYTINSVVVTLSVTGLAVVLGTLAAYGFSRYSFTGSRFMFYSMIASRLFPPVSFVIPFMILFNKFNLTDTRLALIIVNLFLNLPFVVWILIGFFDAIPRELDEAARIDGCSKARAFWKVILPQARPGIVAGAILTFIMTWNEFLFALSFTRRAAKTLPIGITDFYADNFVVWSKVTAASTYAMIPAIIFVLLFQRNLVKGMLQGAVKG